MMEAPQKSEIELLRSGQLTDFDGQSSLIQRLHFLQIQANYHMQFNDPVSVNNWIRNLNAIEDELFGIMTDDEKKELATVTIDGVPPALVAKMRPKIRKYNKLMHTIITAHGLGPRAGEARDIRKAFRR